jgi:hypothetical protein
VDASGEKPTITGLMSFMDSRCRALFHPTKTANARFFELAESKKVSPLFISL